MGIRCQCPNGHTLNLKSFLAGKRGICPQCQAKFIIPRESVSGDAAVVLVADPSVESVSIQTTGSQTPGNQTQKAAAVNTAAKLSTAGVAVSTAPRAGTATAQPPATEQPVPAATASTTAADPTAWYVRLESGEKFGPADTKTLRMWADEGRVPPGAVLWHEGWDDWHKAETVLTGMAIVPPTEDIQPAAGSSSSQASASSWAEHNFPLHNDEPHVQTDGRHEVVTLKHRRRRGESRKIAAITIMLLLLVVMLPVLLLVVFR